MKLINEKTFEIIDYTTLVSCSNKNGLVKHSVISDDLVAEIESKYYETTEIDESGEEQTVNVNLNLVIGLETEQIEGDLFETVTSLKYSDREEAIEAYEAAKVAAADAIIDATFHSKKYKVMASLPEFGDNYSGLALMCDKSPDMVCEYPETEGEDEQITYVYVDRISANMLTLIAAYPDSMSIEENPTRKETVTIEVE